MTRPLFIAAVLLALALAACDGQLCGWCEREAQP